VSDPIADKELKEAEESAGLVAKGLAAGKVGTFSGAILGAGNRLRDLGAREHEP
jgi:hypothetical protein